MQEQKVEYKGSTYKRIPKENLDKLSTKRLLSILRRNNAYIGNIIYDDYDYATEETEGWEEYNSNTVEFYKKYNEDIKEILKGRRNIEK